MTGFLLTLGRLSLLGALLTAVLLLLRPLLRGRLSAALGYYLWLPVLLRLCLPFGVRIPVPAPTADQLSTPAPVSTAVQTPAEAPALVLDPPMAEAAPVPEGPEAGADAPAGAPEPDPAGGSEGRGPALDLPLALTVVWGLGTAACLGRYILGYRRFSQLVRQGEREPSPAAREPHRRLDPAERTALAVSPGASGPLLLGVLRPTVVLPEGVEDPGRLEDILRHELTHARRHDLLYKWFAAAVTSLHWFNPLMLLVRREISRTCELACDEAVVRGLDPALRRRYGETLLSLAAEPPRGLGVLATTLCEEKEQLRERLVGIVKPCKRGPAAAILSAALVLLLGGCALVSGTETASPAPTDSPAPAGLLEEAELYEIGDGLTLAIPADLAENVLVLEPGEGGSGFPSVYEKQSYIDSMADSGGPAGFLFTIVRYDQVQYEQEFLAANGGSGGLDFFARDGEWYYGWATATDVQFYRHGDGTVDTQSQDWQEWEAVYGRMDDIRADFVARNGLEPYDDEEVFGRAFFWEGEHRYFQVWTQGYDLSLTLLLSQPATQGESGIWCVEAAFDNNYGGWQFCFPQTDVPLAEYYQDLQTQADGGHRPGLLDPEQVVQDWYLSEYGYLSVRPELQPLEGSPAGNLWGTLVPVLSQVETLETLGYLNGAEVRPMAWDPETFASSIRSRLYPLVWVQAQAPDTLEGEAVRCTAPGGDSLLFLEEGDLLRVVRDGAESWYRPAYDYQRRAYDRAYELCRETAAQASGLTQEDVAAGEEAVRAWLASQSWSGAALEGELVYDPVWAREQAEVYLEQGSGQGSGLGLENVLALSGDLTDGSTWMFLLVREGPDQPWRVADSGPHGRLLAGG